MKVYISAARTVEQLETQDGKDLAKGVVKQLIELDPTSSYDKGKGGKYCPWIIRQYKSGNLTKDKFESLKDSLDLFAKNYRQFSKNDLNQYKTVDEFLDASREFGNRELTDKELEKLHGKQAHSAGDEDKKFLCEDGDWELWTPLTYAGSIALARSGGGKQAEWCTAWTRSDNYYRDYTSRGPLYIFINKNNTGEKYQSHFGNDGRNSWFYDIDDREQGQAAFFEFLDEHPNFKEFFKVRDTGGIRMMGESFIGYDPKAETITFPDTTSKIPHLTFPDACKEVVLPDSVTEIPARAFLNSNVETVVASNIHKIGPNAFNGSKIANINLSGVDTRIGSSAFRDCVNLKNVTLYGGSNPFSVGPYAFAGSGLSGTVTITPTMTLDMSALDDCPEVTVVWNHEDDDYEFSGIKLLVLDKEDCPKLFNANDGKVDIELM